MGVYTQSVLNQIGYKASVKAISGNIFFTFVQNTKNKVQINVQQWYQDYPAASDFLNILFGCDSFHPGQRLEHQHRRLLRQEDRRQMKHRAALASKNEQAANAEWAKIDQRGDGRRADGHALQPEARGLRLEARRQLHLQQAVLLARLAVVGQVGAVVRALARPLLARRPMSRALPGEIDGAGAALLSAPRRGRSRGAGCCATGSRWRCSVLLSVILALSLAAPLYANVVAHTDPFQSNLDGTTIVTASASPVMQQETSGLGLGVTPVGPTWDPRHFMLGADNQGRDVAARLLYGGRNSLLIGLAAALLTCLLGTFVGVVAGFFGGVADGVL